jgi:hypothetical protein
MLAALYSIAVTVTGCHEQAARDSLHMAPTLYMGSQWPESSTMPAHEAGVLCQRNTSNAQSVVVQGNQRLQTDQPASLAGHVGGVTRSHVLHAGCSVRGRRGGWQRTSSRWHHATCRTTAATSTSHLVHLEPLVDQLLVHTRHVLRKEMVASAYLWLSADCLADN